jgi:cytochrome c oxidase assembly protein subunit 15
MTISTSFKRFTIWCAAVTFLLIIAGAVVRTTGSGDACPDWPLCHGSIIPPLRLQVWIEWSHRLITSVVYSSVLALAIWASLRYRQEKVVVRGAWLAMFLLIFQIVLGGLVVIFGLPPALVGIHLANALLIFGTLITVSLFAHRSWAVAPAESDPRLRKLIVWSAIAVYILVFSGTVVTGTGAASACDTWPLCNSSSGILPDNVYQAIHLTHRYIAAAIGILLFYTLSETLRRHRANRLLRRAAHTAIGLFGLQIIVGGINVLAFFPPPLGTLHLATAAAVFGAMVAFAVIGWQVLGGQTAANAVASGVNPVGQSYPSASSGR